MWKATSVTHYTEFGKETGYLAAGGKTKVTFTKGKGKDKEFITKTLTVKRTRYTQGEYYQLGS